MNMKIVSNDSVIIIYEVEFYGVEELLKYAINKEPKEGVYVELDSELYPCFDSSDYAYEDRYYCNFVFGRSKEEVMKKMKKLVSRSPQNAIYRKLTQELAPMIYWRGDRYYPLEVME